MESKKEANKTLHISGSGKVVTDEMIDCWEDALERDEWPSGWMNVGEIVEGKLPTSLSDAVTLSVKIPVGMKVALAHNAKEHGQTLSAYVRTLLTDRLMAVG